MRTYEAPGPINVGTGIDLSIRELAELIAEIVHPDAELVFDTSKPDGMPRKVLDVSRLNDLGWTASTGLRSGIESTYEWFLGQQ
jgi:GDP-L-fucose synthase